MLAFNGRIRGRPAIFAHVYGTQPASISYTLPFQITQTKGTYGLLLEANLPQIAGEWGNITQVSMTLGRTYRSDGQDPQLPHRGLPGSQRLLRCDLPPDPHQLSVRRRA